MHRHLNNNTPVNTEVLWGGVVVGGYYGQATQLLVRFLAEAGDNFIRRAYRCIGGEDCGAEELLFHVGTSSRAVTENAHLHAHFIGRAGS